jgi:hypothetical protein
VFQQYLAFDELARLLGGLKISGESDRATRKAALAVRS